MPSILLSLAGAALPAALIIAYFIRLDRKRPEPVGLIGRSVLYGFAAVVPAALIELALERFVAAPGGVLGTMYSAFVVAAFVEETTKLFFVKRYLFRRAEFDEVADGIVYAICVSLGFAFVENFIYGYGNAAVLAVRAFTAVPGHAVFSGVMGYYIGVSKLEDERPRAWLRGLAWAIALHGLYDFFLMSGNAALIIPLLAGGWIALRRLFRAASAADEARAALKKDLDGALPSYHEPRSPIL
jgi:RsiW-degrading membrane proteinase PrsW (M82 family)